ncbi:MAG: iron-containing alcohol dehydrogenase [Candidatus Hydrogenedentes bacterium]|nr:iron-containing alcohol dehydrogenase [Candidatus Hydrogenedentota bacterium]
MISTTFRLPTRIRLAAGAVNEVQRYCQDLGHRPLIVTGRRWARESGTLDLVMNQCANAVLFEGVAENPPDTVCDAAAEVCRTEGCDSVIALGGGSVIDVAKGIAGLAMNPGRCRDFYGRDRFAQGALPLLAIPTTAGSGSETTPYAVLVDGEKRAKVTLAGDVLFPRVALLDPQLTLSLPREITLATGLDALSQAMEGYVSRNATVLGDILAIEVCRLICRWLPRALHTPDDLEARSQLMHAATLSGIIIAQSGTTLAHGLGYYLTLRHGMLHGLANAVLLAPLFAYNAAHVPDKVAAIADAMGFPPAPSEDGPAQAIVIALQDLFRRIDFSGAARDYGVPEAVLRGYAEDIVEDPYRFKNQPGSPGGDEIHAILERAWEGV